jgi:hypothetical protein
MTAGIWQETVTLFDWESNDLTRHEVGLATLVRMLTIRHVIA